MALLSMAIACTGPVCGVKECRFFRRGWAHTFVAVVVCMYVWLRWGVGGDKRGFGEMDVCVIVVVWELGCIVCV